MEPGVKQNTPVNLMLNCLYSFLQMRLTTITLLHTVGNTKRVKILSLFGDNQVTMTSIKKESVTLDFSTIYVFNIPFFTSLETKATFRTCYGCDFFTVTFNQTT